MVHDLSRYRLVKLIMKVMHLDRIRSKEMFDLFSDTRARIGTMEMWCEMCGVVIRATCQVFLWDSDWISFLI